MCIDVWMEWRDVYRCVNGMEGCVWMCEWNGGMCMDV